MDSVKTKFLNGSNSIGLEVQTLVYGLKDFGVDNSIFIRKLIINKSGLLIDSMYISLWSDPDIGDGSDDLVGVDTLLKTAIAYNGSNNDASYSNNPPALGYTFFQTPKVSGKIND